MVYRGTEKHTLRLLRELANMLNRRDELRHRLHVVKKVLTDWAAGEIEIGVEPGDTSTELPASTEEYLRIAYEWIEAGNRPAGERPTELWKHLATETGKSRSTIRETFKNRDWHDPHAGSAPESDMSPTEYTIQAVQKAAKRHFG